MRTNNWVRRVMIFTLPFIMLLSISRADLGSINIKMRATLVASGCTVNSASQKLTVNMGDWAKQNFTGGPPVPFAINLEHCSSVTGVTVTFNGQAESSESSLLAVSGAGSAKNVGIAILDKNRKRIPLGQPSDVYSNSSNAESITLNFFSQYVATGEISAGVANADATFSIEYP